MDAELPVVPPELSTGRPRYQWLKSKFCPGGTAESNAPAEPQASIANAMDTTRGKEEQPKQDMEE
jgi:hypothetical protein